MEIAARRIEHAHGWQTENNTWSEINEQGEIVRKPMTCEIRVPQKPKDMENLSGEKSAIRKAQEVFLIKSKEEIKTIDSWEELHTFMYGNGMEYRKKGSGAVVVLGDVTLKASSVSRTLALSRLEERLGAYMGSSRSSKEMNNATIADAQPLDRVNDNSEWKAYISARNNYYRGRKRSREELRQAQREQFKEMKDRQKNERKTMLDTLKAASASRREFGRHRSLLAVQHAYESVKLKESHKEQRGKFQKSNIGFPSYEQWLIEQGQPLKAEAWRHRRNTTFLRIESGGMEETAAAKGINVNLGLLGFSMTETKQGLRFSRNDRLDLAAFIDTGRMIRVYGNDDETLLASLQLAAQKWGSIQLHGSEAYKKRCMELAVEHGIKITNPELQDFKQEVERTKGDRFTDGMAKSRARLAERRAREAEEKRLAEEESKRQQKERQAAEKLARELELKHEKQLLEEERQSRKGQSKGWSR